MSAGANESRNRNTMASEAPTATHSDIERLLVFLRAGGVGWLIDKATAQQKDEQQCNEHNSTAT